MTEADPDAIDPNDTVRLRCYLSSADSVWFSAGCEGLAGCGHVAPIGIRAAIRLMRSNEATARQLERRLQCSRCGNRQVSIMLQPDTRPAGMQVSTDCSRKLPDRPVSSSPSDGADSDRQNEDEGDQAKGEVDTKTEGEPKTHLSPPATPGGGDGLRFGTHDRDRPRRHCAATC